MAGTSAIPATARAPPEVEEPETPSVDCVSVGSGSSEDSGAVFVVRAVAKPEVIAATVSVVVGRSSATDALDVVVSVDALPVLFEDAPPVDAAPEAAGPLLELDAVPEVEPVA